jgi:hypothetical protein
MEEFFWIWPRFNKFWKYWIFYIRDAQLQLTPANITLKIQWLLTNERDITNKFCI